jgi:hypothetical protein
MLAWQGEFRGRWTTDASWSHSDSLANFADVRNTLAKDIVTAESASFRLGYLPHPDWPIYVQLANSNASNSAATLAINDLRTNSTEIGLQYNSPLGNQATLLVRKTSGHYPYLTSLDSDYSQDDIQAGVRWKPGIKSALSLQIGHTRREEDGQPQLNFSGPTEHLTFDWAPMAMTSINATMGRDITPITAITVQGFYLVNYALVQSYGIGALWALTSKVSAGPRIDYQSREVAGVPLDKTTGSSLVLQYAPIRAVQMSMQLKHEVRESDIPGIPYVSNVGMLTATLSF